MNYKQSELEIFLEILKNSTTHYSTGEFDQYDKNNEFLFVGTSVKLTDYSDEVCVYFDNNGNVL